jgi:hypothetical protein
MIAKRIGAALLAVLLIGGAWVVRDRVIEDDGRADASDDEGGDDGDKARVLYCIAELTDVCRAVAAEHDELEVRTEAAGRTLDALAADDAEPAMWLTIDPLPSMVDVLRQSRSLDVGDRTVTALGRSPFVIVVLKDRTPAFVDACGPEPIDLACLSEASDLRPTFAKTDSASGMLGVAAAVTAFTGGPLDVADPNLTVWARQVARAGSDQLSGGTAIETIQTRPSFDVALGAEAELADAQRPKFDVLAPQPVIVLDVVLAVPEGQRPPGDLLDAASTALDAAGWDAAASDSTSTGLPDPGVILAVRQFWEDL